MRNYSGQRFGELKVQRKSFVHVGRGPPEANESSVQLTQEHFTQALKPIPTTPAFWAPLQRPLSLEIRERQYEFRELRWLAAVLRPGIYARLAWIPRMAATLTASTI